MQVRAEYVKVERGTCKQPQPARGVSLRSTMLTLASLPPRVIFVNCTPPHRAPSAHENTHNKQMGDVGIWRNPPQNLI